MKCLDTDGCWTANGQHHCSLTFIMSTPSQVLMSPHVHHVMVLLQSHLSISLMCTCIFRSLPSPNTADVDHQCSTRQDALLTDAALHGFLVYPLTVACQLNLTGPEGYIEAPPQSSSAFHSTVDCSYTITVYMGYGVEIQVGFRLKC